MRGLKDRVCHTAFSMYRKTTKAIYYNKHHIFWFLYGSEETTEPIPINIALLDVNVTGAGLKGICLIYRKRRRRYNEISIMISSFLMISQIFPRLELQNFYIVRGTLLWTRPLRSFSTVSQKATEIYRNKKATFHHRLVMLVYNAFYCIEKLEQKRNLHVAEGNHSGTHFGTHARHHYGTNAETSA